MIFPHILNNLAPRWSTSCDESQSWSDSKEGPERSLRNKESNHSRKCVPALVYYSQSSRCVQIQVYIVLTGTVVPYSSLQLFSLLQIHRNPGLFVQDSRRVVQETLPCVAKQLQCINQVLLKAFKHLSSLTPLSKRDPVNTFVLSLQESMKALFKKTYILVHADRCFIVESLVSYSITYNSEQVGKGVFVPYSLNIIEFVCLILKLSCFQKCMPCSKVFVFYFSSSSFKFTWHMISIYGANGKLNLHVKALLVFLTVFNNACLDLHI